MASSKARTTSVRFRVASDMNREMLRGIPDPKARREFINDLREHEWVVFTPQKIDFERFEELLQRDEHLRGYLEQETDPVLIAEFLTRNYPHIFLSIEHVFEIYTDWKIRRMKTCGYHAGEREEWRAPDQLLVALRDSELKMVARRWLRKEIKRMNVDPRGTLADVQRKLRAEKSPKQRKLLEYLCELMQSLMQERYPEFKPEIVKGLHFPSMHVRHWVRQIVERGNAILVGDVGTHKTSAAVIGLERLGSKAVVVVCRSYATDMWAREIQRYYRTPMNPLVIHGADEFEYLKTKRPADLRRHRFIIVGYGCVQNGYEDDEDECSCGEKLTDMICGLKPDSLIIDEAHAIKGTGCRSKRVLKIAQLPSVRHRIMLSATPFENHPNEVANLATLLDPQTFPTEEVFHAMCHDNPRIFFGLMSQRMCDYFAQEDVLDLPPTNLDVYRFFPTAKLDCPADMRRVHSAILDDGSMEPRLKVLRLTQFLSVPYAARDWYPSMRNADCFCDPMVNPKLEYLRREVAERIKTGKVVIASGIFASGITRSMESAEQDPEVYEIATIFERWFPDKVLRIDGSTKTGATDDGRKAIQARWQSDPDARILIASVPATSESLNFTLRKVPGKVEKVTIFYLALPWKPTQYLQFNGRFHRPGAEVPIEVLSLIVNGTADEALLELNERKWRNFLIGVHGMPIMVEEEEALERATFRKLVLTPSSWMRSAFERMMGLGEDGIRRFLERDLQDLPVAETLAAYYLQMEESGTPGHVSRLLVPILNRWHETGTIHSWEDVLDVGPGPLVLERKLNAPLHAIEINPKMLEIGRTHSYQGGKNAIVGGASHMPNTWGGRFSLAIASLILDLTSRKITKGKGLPERAKVIQELHRVLHLDGLAWIIVQEKCLDRESFDVFLGNMRQYGFEPVEPWCNRIEAVDHRSHHFAVWSLLLRKRTELHDVDPTCPLFAYELPRESVVRRKQAQREKSEPMEHPQVVLHEKFAIRDASGDLMMVEMVTDVVEPPGASVEKMHAGLVKHFRIRDKIFAGRLHQELDRIRPRSLTELKEIWKRLREHDGAPRISWAELSEFARAYFRAS